MDLDDILDPKVGIAVAVTALVATPTTRKWLRKGAVYGLAGALMAGDRIAAFARSAGQSAQEYTASLRGRGEQSREGQPHVATS